MFFFAKFDFELLTGLIHVVFENDHSSSFSMVANIMIFSLQAFFASSYIEGSLL